MVAGICAISITAMPLRAEGALRTFRSAVVILAAADAVVLAVDVVALLGPGAVVMVVVVVAEVAAVGVGAAVAVGAVVVVVAVSAQLILPAARRTVDIVRGRSAAVHRCHNLVVALRHAPLVPLRMTVLRYLVAAMVSRMATVVSRRSNRSARTRCCGCCIERQVNRGM